MTDPGPRPRISELVKGYQYPRTVDELVRLRLAQLEALGPQQRICPSSKEHGPMPLREISASRQTYEQLYCGLWWDCKACHSGSTQPSRDLAYDHGEPYNTGRGFEKFDGRGWVPISEAEVEAFWAKLTAWHEARQPKPKRRRQRAAHRHALPPSPVAS